MSSERISEISVGFIPDSGFDVALAGSPSSIFSKKAQIVFQWCRMGDQHNARSIACSAVLKTSTGRHIYLAKGDWSLDYPSIVVQVYKHEDESSEHSDARSKKLLAAIGNRLAPIIQKCMEDLMRIVDIVPKIILRYPDGREEEINVADMLPEDGTWYSS